MTSRQTIADFLAHKRLAVVGVSRNPKDFTRVLFSELLRRGYDAVPVNPNVAEVDGVKCFSQLADVNPPVEGALLLTKPSVTDDVVAECAAAGVHHVWLYRAVGQGAVSPKAIAFCESNGMDVVAGECPFMFFPDTAWPHRLHGFCRKLLRTYPS
jgi:predicted CoA-binding protein